MFPYTDHALRGRNETSLAVSIARTPPFRLRHRRRSLHCTGSVLCCRRTGCQVKGSDGSRRDSLEQLLLFHRLGNLRCTRALDLPDRDGVCLVSSTSWLVMPFRPLHW